MNWLSSSYKLLCQVTCSTVSCGSALVCDAVNLGHRLIKAQTNQDRLNILQDSFTYTLYLTMKYGLKVKNKGRSVLRRLLFAYNADSEKLNQNVLRIKFFHHGSQYMVDVPTSRKLTITKPTYAIKHKNGVEFFKDRSPSVPLLVSPDKYGYSDAEYVVYASNAATKVIKDGDIHKSYLDG